MILFLLEAAHPSDHERDPSKSKGSDPIFPFVRNRRWGFVNRQGEVVVSPKFVEVGSFFQGVANVTLEAKGNRKKGFIDSRGQMIITANYDDAGDFREGLAPVRLGRKWGFINLRDRFTVSPKFQGAGEFHEGLAVVQLWNQWPKTGPAYYTEETAPLSFFRLLKDNFLLETENSTLLFPDRYDSKIGFINPAGNFAIQLRELDLADDFSDGRARISSQGKRNFLTREGTLLSAEWFDYALPFSEGMASIQVNLKWGVIDTNGRVIIPPEFDFVGSFSEGLAVVSVSIDGKTRRGKRLQGAIDKTGKMVIRPSFESLSEFREGFAVASQGTAKFFVDRTGARAQITNLPVCWGFRDGLAIVGPSGQRVYVDKNGRIVAPFDKVGI
jgi:hypothetical protein